MILIKKQMLGFHKKNKRIWLNHGTIQGAGMAAGEKILCEYDYEQNVLVITKSDKGANTIADTFKGAVIDVVNASVTRTFSDYDSVEVKAESGRITIRGSHNESRIIEREKRLKRRVETGQPLRKGGAFAGMGLLCRSIHRGLSRSGVSVEQVFANELALAPAEVNLGGNEIWDDAPDEAVFCVDDIYTMNMDIVPTLDVLVMGSPCPAFSQVNTKRAREGRVDVYHPETGTIFQPMLELIKRSNPAVVILENSKHFKGSITDFIVSDVMMRFGYDQVETIVTGTEFGDFEHRERICRVWYSKGLASLDLSDLPFKSANTRKLSDILEPMDDADGRWGRRRYLEAKDAQAHNGHKYCIVSPDASRVPTCGANYHKIQPDSLMVGHPNDRYVTRILTTSEHCNLRDVDGALKQNVLEIEAGTHYANKSSRGSASEAHKMLGNSCSPKPWESVGYHIGVWIIRAVLGGEGRFVREALNCKDSLTFGESDILSGDEEAQLGFCFD